ncbi:MAG: methyltransferase domain-containing protein [Methylotetracoccus sp.]
MTRRLVTTTVRTPEDIRAFFDTAAGHYAEAHGNAGQLLGYRLAVLRSLLPPPGPLHLVELGCGPGEHLLALCPGYEKATGLDLSPAMIDRARANHAAMGSPRSVRFAVDDAARLDRLGDASVDALFCVGTFEHLPHKVEALKMIHRVLAPGATFVCLTLNGDYLWYASLAPSLGLATKHLSSDEAVGARELHRLLAATGLQAETTGYWTFIPRGDMPKPLAGLLSGLDRVGRLLRMSSLRGGLYVKATKPR